MHSRNAVNDFDFLHGSWRVTHRKLARRLAGCIDWQTFPGTLEVQPLPDGRGNFDVNRLADPTGPYEAHSLRLFDAGTGSWSIWWIDWRTPNEVDPPVRGGFRDGNGSFFSEDWFDGRPIQVRTTYRMVGPDAAEWTQTFTANGHGNWEVNWVMEFERTA